MNTNGSSNRCVWWWAQHLESKVNEEVRIVQTHGLTSDNVREMLEEFVDLARGTKCQNPFYEIHTSPAPGERLTDKQWDRTREMIESHHGFEGQPYFMVMHTKHGEEHVHWVYSRIDLETGKTISDSHDARTNHAISRQIEEEFGLRKVIGPYDREPGTARPERGPKRWEMLRGMETGIDPREVKAEVTALHQQSENGPAFRAALKENGYELVTGDRGLLIFDAAGKEHSLARRCGIKVKELDAFMREVDRNALPTLAQAQAAYKERNVAQLEADQAQIEARLNLLIWDRDKTNQAWEDALITAAIEKEKSEPRFAEPKNRSTPVGKEELTGPARDIRQAVERSDNAQGLLNALAESHISLGRVTNFDAVQSQLDSAEASISGSWKPTFREGEIVAVARQGQLYRLTPRNTGKAAAELEQFLAGLQTPLASVEDTCRQSEENRRFLRLPDTGPELSKTAGDIRLAYNLADSPQAFRELLEQNGLTTACVTAPDIRERDRATEKDEKDQREVSALSDQEKRPHGLSKYTREGDVVVLDHWGNIYELTNRTTGDKRQNAQAFLAGIGPLPSIEEVQKQKQRTRDIEAMKPRGRWAAGPQHGGMVENQSWAMDRAKSAEEQRGREEQRRFAEEAKKASGELDPSRYLSDPDYRREVKLTQMYKNSYEQKAERESDLRASMEQQDRQR